MDPKQEKQAVPGAPRQANVREARAQCGGAHSRERIRELLGWKMLLPDSMARPYSIAD